MLGQEGGALHLKELTAAEPEGGGFFGLGLMNHPKVALSTAAGTVVLAFTDGGQADFLEQVQAAWKESKATAAAASAAAPTQASASGLLDSSIPSMASLFGTPGQASPPLPPTPCFAPAPAQGAATAEQQAQSTAESPASEASQAQGLFAQAMSLHTKLNASAGEASKSAIDQSADAGSFQASRGGGTGAALICQ
jgi:hypothetical protein